MLEYLNFCLLCALLALILYLYVRMKRYLPLLKMVEEIFSGYESPQSDTKGKKLLECVLTRNSKLYLGKVYTEEQLKNLVKKKWKNFLQSKWFMLAPLTSKFLVQPSNAECVVLETTHKDSRQMFQHSDRMFKQIFQI